MPELKGLATGIGSLPHQDVEAALDLIFKCTPYIPFWPQLPNRDIREGMVAQFSENLPCLKVARNGLFFSTHEDKGKELEIFYERIIAGDADYFKISQDFALGLHKFYQRLENSDLENIEFIKGQITGPFTFSTTIKDEKGRALLYDPVFMQVILKALIMKALWQVKFFEKFGKRIIMFVDEPYLACFGSAYTPINRDDVVMALTELTEGIKSKNVLLGVHCCGNTDWSIFTDVKTIDIINFDAFSFLDRFILYADNLREFINRGGIICWGVVPTGEFSGTEAPDTLIGKLWDAINALSKKGVDKNLLLKNLLISPSCGMATLDIEKSGKICSLLSQVSKEIIRQ